MAAAWYGHNATVQILLHVGVKNESNTLLNEDTPLHNAAERGRTDTVQLLLDAGANKDVITQHETPLHWAKMYGHTDIVKLLLNAETKVLGKRKRSS